MPRIARVVVPGLPHHVTQRGNRRADVFFRDDDRRRYLHLLGEYSRRHGVAIWAYCLMTNHVHFVAVPSAAHCGGPVDPLLGAVEMPWPVPDWSAYLQGDSPEETAAIRRQTTTGRPCGSPPFVKRLESTLGRLLTPRKRGRKARKKKGEP